MRPLAEAASFLFRRRVFGWPAKALLGVLAAVMLIRVCPKPPLNLGISFSREVYDRRGTLLRLTLS